jgi:hypothetical protein
MTPHEKTGQTIGINVDGVTWRNQHALWLTGKRDEDVCARTLMDGLKYLWDVYTTSYEEQQIQTLVIAWQKNHRRLARKPCTEEEQLRQALVEISEELWERMREPLTPLVYQWISGPSAQEMFCNPASYPCRERILESLQLHCFAYIVEALPRINIDPSRSLCGYLVKIAHHRICDEYRSMYRNTAQREISLDIEDTPTQQHAFTFTMLARAAAEACHQEPWLENQIIDNMTKRNLSEAIWVYCSFSWSPNTCVIAPIQIRFFG